MENFEPEKVIRYDWDDEGIYSKDAAWDEALVSVVQLVDAEDYDKLLALYRGAVDNAEGYKGTIKTIWTQLGDPTYEELKGRGIFEVIQELIDKVHPQSTTTIVTSGTAEIK